MNSQSKRPPSCPCLASRRLAIGKPTEEFRIPRFAELDAQIDGERATGRGQRKGRRTRKRKRRDVPKNPAPADPTVRAAVQAGADHKRDYRPDRDAAERMVKAYRAALIPRKPPGVKPQSETVQAAELYRARTAEAGAGNQGVTYQFLRTLWQGIKREVIPGFDALDKYERKYRGDELRRNVKDYLKRRGVELPLPVRPQRKRKTAIP